MAFDPDGQFKSTLNIRVGSTFKKKWQWKAGEPTPVPVDLTGWTAKCDMRAKASDPTPILSVSSGSNTPGTSFITLNDQGEIYMEIEFGDAGTELFSGVKKGVFDVELTNADGTFRRNLIGGNIVIFGEVTQP